MSSILIKFLKALVKALGSVELNDLVNKHANENNLSLQSRRDLVDELEAVGISVEHNAFDNQAVRAQEDEKNEPKHNADQAKADEDRKDDSTQSVAVVDSQGVVQKVVEVQENVNVPETAEPLATVANA